MKRAGERRCAGHAGRGRGFVLVTALLILLVLSLLSASMFRSFALQENIAGSTREKQRAFHSAQSALQYGEWWLAQGNSGSGAACTGLLDASAAPPTTQICDTALKSDQPPTGTQIAIVPWKYFTDANIEIGVQYTPGQLATSANGGVNTYSDRPRFHIFPLGPDPSGFSQLYQVSAWAYGGHTNAISVVQSVYSIKSGVIDAGGL